MRLVVGKVAIEKCIRSWSNKMIKRILFFILLVQIGSIYSAKILGFLTSPSKSHFIYHESLLRELAVRGHDVTLYSFYNQTGKELPNYRWITIEEDGQFDELRAQLITDAQNNGTNIFKKMPKFVATLVKMGSAGLKDPKFLELKKESFDLVVLGWFFNDFQLGVAGHFRCPSVISATLPGAQMLRNYVGSPNEYSTVSFSSLGYKGTMNFRQRLTSFLAKCAEFVVTKAINYFVFEPAYIENFPPDQYPSFDEVKKNVSLVLLNDHFSQSMPAANVPALLEVAGMHIKSKPNPLPKDIQEFLDSATEGAIFFSFGSNINSADLPAEKRDIILGGLRKLKQKVLWKFEDEHLPNKPDNVKIGKWLPQDDILAHPNVKLFISHCGKGSVNEAKYHGVPILGVPMFADQHDNLDAIVEEGWAVPLFYSTLTEDSIISGVNELLTNPKYSKVVKTSSDLFKDRPMSPLETAAFWVEYVLRHNGARHMQSNAVHLNVFQYYSLDVLAVLFLIIYVSFKLSKFLLKLVFRKCFEKLKLKKE